MRSSRTRRVMRSPGSRRARATGAGAINSAYARGLSSPHFRPFLYVGMIGVLLTALLSWLFGIERGLVAVVLGGVTVVVLAFYWRAEDARSQEDIASRRDAFFRKLVAGDGADEDA